MMKCEWILCPVCGSKTRNKIRKDTVLKNYPLYCPKCRQERLIRGRELRACPLCPFRSVPVREMALECVFQKKVEKSKMRPSARRGRAQRKCKKYLDVLTVHTHSRNIPLAEHSFF